MDERSIVILVAAVLGAVLKSVLDWAWWWVSRPVLKMNFNENEAGFKVSTLESRVNPSDASKPLLNNAFYYNVGVRNKRTRTATNVRGFLVSIEELEANGTWRMTDYCDNIPLAWSYREDDDARKGIDIPRDVPQFLNVLSVRHPSVAKGFIPATVPQTLKRASLMRFEEPGTFRFTIMVAADDSAIDWMGLRVEWDGDWAEVWKNDCAGLRVREDTTIRFGTGMGLLR